MEPDLRESCVRHWRTVGATRHAEYASSLNVQPSIVDCDGCQSPGHCARPVVTQSYALQQEVRNDASLNVMDRIRAKVRSRIINRPDSQQFWAEHIIGEVRRAAKLEALDAGRLVRDAVWPNPCGFSIEGDHRKQWRVFCQGSRVGLEEHRVKVGVCDHDKQVALRLRDGVEGLHLHALRCDSQSDGVCQGTAWPRYPTRLSLWSIAG